MTHGYATNGLGGGGGDAGSAMGRDRVRMGRVDALIREHETCTIPALRMLWKYYRNPMSGHTPLSALPGASLRSPTWSGRWYRLGQESGLPARLSGAGGFGGRVGGEAILDDRGWTKREIVIENDIAWRVHLMVDFMFGRPVRFVSLAKTEQRRRLIERVLDAVWEGSGGIALLQDAALLAHVYGHVDLLVRTMPGSVETAAADGDGSSTPEAAAARCVRIEAIEPLRGIPILDPMDYRRLSGYIIRYRRSVGTPVPAAGAAREDRAPGGRLPWGFAGPGIDEAMLAVRPRHSGGGGGHDHDGTSLITEIWSGGTWRVYEEVEGNPSTGRPPPPSRRLISEGVTGAHDVAGLSSPTSLAPPIAHIQNLSQPFCYAGLGEVEPLIPLQDELNTRLSDRASRVTMQAFKMYLAKGIDGFGQSSPVGPGQVWTTDNLEARVESFGGDAGAGTGETEHIEDIREAMDKISGVPPLAGGVVRAKIGNLSSENALRVTLTGLLSKTARKRVTYGRGLIQASEMALAALDAAGILPTAPEERAIRVEWPDLLPRDEGEALAAAMRKIELGVPRDRVLSELGYATADAGVE